MELKPSDIQFSIWTTKYKENLIIFELSKSHKCIPTMYICGILIVYMPRFQLWAPGFRHLAPPIHGSAPSNVPALKAGEGNKPPAFKLFILIII